MILLAVILVLASGVVITVEVLNAMSRSRWNTYIAQMQERGERMTVDKIVDSVPATPPGPHVAGLLEGLASQFMDLRTDDVDGALFLDYRLRNVDVFDGVPSESFDKSLTLLSAHRVITGKLLSLRGLPPGRSSIDYHDLGDYPMDFILPSFLPWGEGPRVLQVLALDAMRAGDVDQALDAIEALMQVAHAGSSDGFLIYVLSQFRTERCALNAAECLLGSSLLDAQQLRRLSSILEPIDSRRSFQRGWQLERASIAETFNGICEGKIIATDVATSSNEPPAPEWARFIPEFMIREEQLMAVDALTPFIEVADDPLEALRGAERARKRLDALPKKHGFSRLFVFDPSRSATLYVSRAVKFNCTKAALAAERFRLDHGRLPATWDDLVPAYLDEVPPDHFDDGAPLRLAKTHDGIVIYSVGFDRIDDGGRGDVELEAEGLPDVGFRLRHPELREFKFIEEETGNE